MLGPISVVEMNIVPVAKELRLYLQLQTVVIPFKLFAIIYLLSFSCFQMCFRTRKYLHRISCYVLFKGLPLPFLDPSLPFLAYKCLKSSLSTIKIIQLHTVSALREQKRWIKIVLSAAKGRKIIQFDTQPIEIC